MWEAYQPLVSLLCPRRPDPGNVERAVFTVVGLSTNDPVDSRPLPHVARFNSEFAPRSYEKVRFR
jgi:hypothetical protein